MPDTRPLSIPVILGTSRKGRMSAHAARFVLAELQKRDGVATELIDIAALQHCLDDNGQGTADPGFAASMTQADAIVIVTPEYNHAMPGLLKHVLDSCLKEYVHKAAGIVAVSAGPFGGTRVIESSLPILRELGLVQIFWDVNVGSVGKVFDESGQLVDQAFVRRTDKFLGELIWMARTLRHGRELFAAASEPEATMARARSKLRCPKCGTEMNHHADKLVHTASPDEAGFDPSLDGFIEETHACPKCGNVEARRALAS